MSIFSEKKPNAISIPLYVGGAIVQLSGLAAVAYQLTEPSFAYFTMVLTVIGLTCSYFLRRSGSPPRLIQMVAVIIALVFICAVRGVGPFQNLVPFEAQGSQQLLLVCSLAFTATFCSFVLVTDESVIFTCVWAIAIIGLTGTVNINQELVYCFVVFLVAAAFLLVHQNSLFGGMPTITEATLRGDDGDTEQWAEAIGGRRVVSSAGMRFDLLKTQSIVALACAVTAILLGFLIAIPMQMIGRNLSLAGVIQRLNVPPASAQKLSNSKSGAVPLVFDNPREFQVGVGPVGDDQTERATVQSPKPLYWRGRVFDSYNGHGWSNSYSDRDVPNTSVMSTGNVDGEGFNTFKIPTPTYPRAKVEKIKYRFHVDSGSFAPLYMAAEPEQVRIPSSQLILRPDNTVAALNSYGYEYEAVSEIPNTKPSDLRKLVQQGYPTQLGPEYLQYPDNPALDELTEKIISDSNATDSFSKAESLRQWISNNCTYTLDAPAVPHDADAAEYFLKKSKQGYCDLYATSLAILCRHAGLPSRVATGFAPGTEVPGSKVRTYVLREADRHAWTEVYFQGYGWLVFDATQDTPGTMNAATTPAPKVDERTFWERLLGAGWVPLSITIVGLCGFLYFLTMETLNAFRGRSFGGWTSQPGNVSAVTRDIVNTYKTASKRLARHGVRRQPSTTTTEYLHAVRETLGNRAADAFQPLTALMQIAVYGSDGGGLDGDAARKAHSALHELDQALKEPRDAPG